MKGIKKTLLILVLFSVSGLYAQSPFGVSYQAVLRNAAGQVLSNQSASIRISLTNSSGTVVHYKESHNITTNAFGLFNLVIGKGTAIEGSYNDAPWKNGGIYLTVELKFSTSPSYTEFERKELFAVPYALFAADGLSLDWQGSLAAAPNSPLKNYAYYNTTDKISYVWDGDSWEVLSKDGATGPVGPVGPAGPLVPGIAGQTLSHNGSTWVANGTIVVTDSSVNIVPKAGHNVEKPIFAVLNSTGQVVFAVYESGVKSFVGPDTKGAKGGFAIGGLSTSGKGSVEYFKLTPDSTRIYFDDIVTTPGGKGAKGGFAIGGLSTQGKAVPTEYLRITADSTRLYIDDAAKGAKGGFAIGGKSTQGKGITKNYFEVTKDSIYITNTVVSTSDLIVGGNVSENVGITETQLVDTMNNTYKTIKIGTQVWMAENLMTTKYASGAPIIDTALTYNNSTDLDTLRALGKLYSYTAIKSAEGLCPTGWHVPTDIEWNTLFAFVGGQYYQQNSVELGAKLSEAKFEGNGGYWINQGPAFQPTNSSGFTARPGGRAEQSSYWFSYGKGYNAYFWSFDAAVPRLVNIDGYSGTVNIQEGTIMQAVSVRCVKN